MRFSHELIVPEEGLPFKLFLFEGRDGNYFREKHWHRSVEIFAVCRGDLGFFIDDKQWHLSADQFMIVNSNEVHSIDSPMPNETIVLQIPLKMFEEYFTVEQFIWFTHEPGKKDERFMELLKELYRVYTERQIGYNLKVKSIFYNIMYLLIKEYRLTQIDQDSVRKNRNLSRLSTITSYMKENYAGEMTLEAVARIFGYSPAYLSRMFQKYAGITFKSYLQSIRLRYALKDLESGKYSITETALRNGFSGSKGLARAFQKTYGMLPSEYREKTKNGH
ncbi:MAG TPA: AraC family transcriptional regulator [Candidatus Mediterraneibacter caccogallinarum]|nr:AraC family transcriptional regulator [Candidatus Mediterraneibacter caccogallinarum]